MPSSEIARICTTVATIQFLCNIAGNWLVFNNGPYRKAVERLERTTKAKDLASRDAAEQHKGQKASKRAKRAKRVEEEHQTAVALVAGMHVLPGLLTNVVFFILLRIFGAEMKGKILGVLPFSPFSLLRRLSSRGLDFNPNGTFDGSSPSVIGVEQACSSMFIYILTTSSIKYYVNKVFGTPTPPGVDGLSNILEKATATVEADMDDKKSS